MTAQKIFFVINSLIPGGAERSLVELLPDLRTSGFEPVVVCLYEREVGFQDEVTEGGFDLRYLNPGSRLSQIRQLRKMLQSERPSLVHTVLFEADIVGRVAAMGTGIPVTGTLANTTYEPARIEADENLKAWRVGLVRWLDGLTARHLARQFHAVSEAVKNSAVESLGLDPATVTVIYRGRDTQRLGIPSKQRRDRVRNELGVPDETVLLLTVGRQEYQKGHVYLLEAFSSVVKNHPDTKLLVAGRTGNASAHLQRLTLDLGIASNVELMGHRTDVPDLLVAADVFVFPSLWEGLGGALIEALALELPIVASDLPALREVVGGGEFGILVPPGDSAALADAISGLVTDERARRELSRGGRDRFDDLFSLDTNNQLLVDFLMSAAA